MPDLPNLPPLQQPSPGDHAGRALAGHPEPDHRNRMAIEVARMAPLQRLQDRYRQVADNLNTYRTHGPATLPGDVRDYIRQELATADRERATLKAAHEAAESMHAEMTDQIKAWEKAMSKPKDAKDTKAGAPDVPPQAEHPQLTTDGSPHPLEEGGYDADKDPQLPGNVSDVEALKEGKTTRQQAEALAEADTAGGDEDKDDGGKGGAARGTKGRGGK